MLNPLYWLGSGASEVRKEMAAMEESCEPATLSQLMMGSTRSIRVNIINIETDVENPWEDPMTSIDIL